MPSAYSNGVCSTTSNGLNKKKKCPQNIPILHDQRKSDCAENCHEISRTGACPTQSPQITTTSDPTNATAMSDSSSIAEQSASSGQLTNPGSTVGDAHFAPTTLPQSLDADAQLSASHMQQPFVQPIPQFSTPYDPSMQTFLPGVPCPGPNCVQCYPTGDALSYYPQTFIPGSSYPALASSNAAANQPYYVWFGQDTETQKHLYQAQMAMSNLNLNPSSGLPPECALGVPLIQSTPATVSLDPSLAYVATSGVTSQPTSIVSIQPTSNSAQHPSGATTSNTTKPSSDPSHLGATPYYVPESCLSTANKALSVSTDLSTLPNAPLWPTGTYYGSNAYWYPPPYATYPQQLQSPYYSTIPMSMGQMSPVTLGNYTDPTMKDKYSLPDYSTFSVNPVYASPPHVSAAKPNSFTVPPYGQSSLTYNAGPQPLNWLNPTQCQLLLNSLAASKNTHNPMFQYGGDRAAGVNRRRVPFIFNSSRTGISKVLDTSELSHLKSSVNPSEFDESLLVNARYFVIRSDSEYNVRQSILHNVWCSTRAGNQCLDEAYHSVQVPVTGPKTSTNAGSDAEQTKMPGHILLFFSVRSSGHLNGVAEMIGPVNPQKRCSIWQEARFRGEIPVRWIYVKNVPNSVVSHILIESHENRPITGLRDTTEILPAKKAEEILRIIHNFDPHHPSREHHLVRTLPPAQV